MERSHGKERHAPEIQGLMRTGAGQARGKSRRTEEGNCTAICTRKEMIRESVKKSGTALAHLDSSLLEQGRQII